MPLDDDPRTFDAGKSDGALMRAYQRWGFTRVTLGLFLAMDVSFKCLVVPAFLDLLPRAQGPSPGRLALHTSCVTLGAFLLIVLGLSRGPARWFRVREAGTPEGIRRAANTLRTFPGRMAVAWAAQWVLLIASLAYRVATPSPIAVAFFLLAMALGPLPLAHGLCAWLAAPIVREVSLAAQSKGVETGAPPLSLRWRLAVYALLLAFAPVVYMTSVAFAARDGALSNAHLLTTVVLFFAAIALFAVLAAVLLATTITGPVAEMAQVMRNIILQGDVSQAGRVPIYHRDEVGALAHVTNQMVTRLEESERDRREAANSLARLNHDLELRVEHRTHELSARNGEMRLVFDSVEQGLFTLDAAGRMSSQCSAVLERWFGPPNPEEPFHDYFRRLSPSLGEALELAWSQVEAGMLPMHLALEQLPKQFEHGSRHYRLRVAAISGTASAQFLAVVSDATREIEHEALQRARKETLALFERMLDDRPGLLGFLAEGSALVERAVESCGRDQGELMRALHTLKGGSALYGLESVAALCHDLETEIVEGAGPVLPAALGKLEARWGALREEAERLLGTHRNLIDLSAAQHQELEAAVQNGAGKEQVLTMLRRLKLEPAERRLSHLAEYARKLGQRLGKPLRVDVSHDGVRLDPRRYAPLWAALQHALRNAVDHGLESGPERLAQNKPELGRIDLRARHDGASLVIEVEDDGRGIAWDALRARALSKGIAVPSQTSLVRVLFAGGISTAASVSDLSGRGVGMGALRDAAEGLGGHIDVTSELRRGTCLRLTFPPLPDAPAQRAPRAPDAIDTPNAGL